MSCIGSPLQRRTFPANTLRRRRYPSHPGNDRKNNRRKRMHPPLHSSLPRKEYMPLHSSTPNSDRLDREDKPILVEVATVVKRWCRDGGGGGGVRARMGERLP